MEIFLIEDKGDNCQRAALDGLGGVGKTHIALEFAFKLQEYSLEHSVYWVQAHDATSFEKSYRDIGKILDIPGIDNDKADVKELVRQRLSKESTGKWLLIVDNADNAQLFQTHDDSSLFSCLPFSNLGGILFTTRNHEVATDHAEAEVISIGMMDDSESRELLRTTLQKKHILNDIESTSELLELLAHLPLAIKQAGAYLNKKNITISKYVDMYKNSNDTQIKLLAMDFEDKWRYKGMRNPVATTWLISFEQVKQQDDLAARYMAFMSCISENNIPLSILPPALEFDQLDAIGTLIGFGFLTEQTSEGVYNMHRLVHIATRNWLEIRNELPQVTTRAVEQVAAVFPRPEYKNRDTWSVYLPHAECLIDAAEVFDTVESLRWDILGKLGRCFWLTGKDEKSIERNKKALEMKERVLGREDPSTLSTISNITASLINQGKYAKAETIYREILVLQEKVLGKEHLDTLVSMNNLGQTLISQRKDAEAETIHRETLVLKEKVLGKEHPSTLVSMNQLGQTLNSQGKYAEAETIHQETLALREKVLGKEHPDTLISVYWVAHLLRKQRQFNNASEFYRRALLGFEKVLGKDHPHTVSCSKQYKDMDEDLRLRDEGNEA